MLVRPFAWVFCVAVSISGFSPAEFITYNYDEAGRLTRVDYGGGKTITYTYDKSGNLVSRVVTSGEAPSTEAAVKRDSKADQPVRASSGKAEKKAEDRRR
jgi:YD repeat-containing protein